MRVEIKKRRVRFRLVKRLICRAFGHKEHGRVNSRGHFWRIDCRRCGAILRRAK